MPSVPRKLFLFLSTLYCVGLYFSLLMFNFQLVQKSFIVLEAIHCIGVNLWLCEIDYNPQLSAVTAINYSSIGEVYGS